MKYVIIPKPGNAEIREMEKPELTEGNAVLRLLFCGICGSDMGTYKGTFLYVDYPRIPGHEFSAVIDRIGPNSLGLKEGMTVTANPYFNCGHCYSCQRGHVNCCTSNETLGAQRDGAMREYISIPIDRIYDGKGLAPRILALIEPFCISYHAAKRAEIKPGQKVLVVGSGTIGYFAALAAKMMGGEVYVSDISQIKLDMVKKAGISGTILNSGKETFIEQVNAITGGNGFDVCLEAVGLPSTFLDCIEAAAYRARIVIIGIAKQNVDFNFSVIQKKELELYGSRNAKKEDFEELIDLVGAGKVDIEPVISQIYDLQDAAKAFEETSRTGLEKLKVMIRF